MYQLKLLPLVSPSLPCFTLFSGLWTNLSIYPSIIVWVFAWETWVQSQIESYESLKKWYLMSPCVTQDDDDDDAITKHLCPVMVNRIGTVYPCGSNKGFSSRFNVDSWIWYETPEEGRTAFRPKRCEYNNKNEVSSRNILSNNKLYGSWFIILWFQSLHMFTIPIIPINTLLESSQSGVCNLFCFFNYDRSILIF